MIRLFKPPRWITWFFPRFTWRFYHFNTNEIYLTFDDGPHPDITPFVLDELKKNNWKATFFCVGKNIELYPEIVNRIREEGHAIGNHTQSHENGRKTSTQKYIQSFQEFEKHTATHLFRPPYGMISRKQSKIIGQTHKIILWSWLSYDYDKKVSVSRILKRAKHIQSGEIIVMHDNVKIKARQMELLPQFIALLHEKGFRSSAIPPLVS